MGRPKVAKSRRPQAERAGEHFLCVNCQCLLHTIRRAVRTQWQAVDFWAADIMGKTEKGFNFYAQVTAGQVEAVRTRRRKLEKIPWNCLEKVLLLQLVEQQNPANARRKDYFFRIHRLDTKNLIWSVDDEACPVPRLWFTKLNKEQEKNFKPAGSSGR